MSRLRRACASATSWASATRCRTAIEQLGAERAPDRPRRARVGRPVAVRRHRDRRARLRTAPRPAREQSSAARVCVETAARCWSSTTSSSSTRRSTGRIRRRWAPTASPTRTRRSRSSSPIIRCSRRRTGIGPETWAGWVQERGLYFLGERDPRYVDLVRLERSVPVQQRAEDRRAGRGARRQGPVDLHRAGAVAAAAGRAPRRVSAAGQPPVAREAASEVRARIRELRPQRELRGREGAVPRAADGDPLRAPGDARASRGSCRAPTRARSATALDSIDLDEVRQVRYDGTLRGSVLLRRALIVAGAAARTPPAACTPRARATTST